MASDFDSVAYNLRHTDLMRRCAREYEARGYTVTLESQNEFRLHLAGATVSGRMDLVATRDQESGNHRRQSRQAQRGPRRPGHALHALPAAAGSRHLGENRNRRGILRGGPHGGHRGRRRRERIQGAARGLDRTDNGEDSAQESTQLQRMPFLPHHQGILSGEDRRMRPQLCRCTPATRHSCPRPQRGPQEPNHKLRHRQPQRPGKYHQLHVLRIFRRTLYPERPSQSQQGLRPHSEIVQCHHRIWPNHGLPQGTPSTPNSAATSPAATKPTQ